MIEIINGNLLDAFDKGEVDVIAHCVNCQGVMGSGIAKSIRDRYHEAYTQYLKSFLEAAEEGCSREKMLGHIEVVQGVANLYGQFDYGVDKRHLNYGALSSSLERLSTFSKRFDEDGRTIAESLPIIGFPYKMGCDRAGGDWEIVLEMIEFFFKDHTVKIYKLGD